ncbi:MAG: adenylate/guanylate cyclase domain-containing protein [Mycobacterium sp.]|nr:adenylate/guanylate cyclase domain-containing protein [Mycobacterium sp.]
MGEIGVPECVTSGSNGPLGWFQDTNHSPAVIDFIRRARRSLPGDPEFGDPLSTAGEGGPRAVARAADRLMPRGAAHEVGLAGLQVWQALTERVSGRPVNPEVTIVFTDLVGFSNWSLSVGDETTLRLLRRVAQVFEPPLLEAGGHIVKRMGDGSMAVFRNPVTALRAVVTALDALSEVEIDGYRPTMRAGIHTGRPQRIGSDWLGVDVNIAARVMERAAKGGLIVSQPTLGRIDKQYLDAIGVTPKKVRKQLFAAKIAGVPEDLSMYWIRPRKDAGTEPDDGDVAEG